MWQALSLLHQWHVMDAFEQLRQSWYEAQASAEAGRGIHASTSTSADSSSVHSVRSPRRLPRCCRGGHSGAAIGSIRGGRPMAQFQVKKIKVGDH